MENNLTPKQALESIKHIYYYDEDINNGEHINIDLDEICKEELDIIEQAFDELENLKEEVNDLNYSKELLLDKLDEQKQILEVLKNVSCIKISEENGRYFVGSHDWWRDITKEEFNLIKEWLK